MMKYIVICETILFLALCILLGIIKEDMSVAHDYIRELEEVVEANGDCAADCCDKCIDYHKVWGD